MRAHQTYQDNIIIENVKTWSHVKEGRGHWTRKDSEFSKDSTIATVNWRKLCEPSTTAFDCAVMEQMVENRSTNISVSPSSMRNHILLWEYRKPCAISLFSVRAENEFLKQSNECIVRINGNRHTFICADADIVDEIIIIIIGILIRFTILLSRVACR